jgi:hypothetical protein
MPYACMSMYEIAILHTNKQSFLLLLSFPPSSSVRVLRVAACGVWLRVRGNVREIHAFVFAVNEECGSASLR